MELALADLASVDKQLNKYTKQARSGGDKEALKLVTVLEKICPVLNEGKPARSVDLSKDEKAVIKQLCLLTMKPVMYVANVEEDGFENNALLEEVKAVGVEEKLLWLLYAPRLRQKFPIFRMKKNKFSLKISVCTSLV